MISRYNELNIRRGLCWGHGGKMCWRWSVEMFPMVARLGSAQPPAVQFQRQQTPVPFSRSTRLDSHDVRAERSCLGRKLHCSSGMENRALAYMYSERERYGTAASTIPNSELNIYSAAALLEEIIKQRTAEREPDKLHLSAMAEVGPLIQSTHSVDS